jgi:DNA polymerase III subunit epsilon
MTKKRPAKKRKPEVVRLSRFAALDFETADCGRDSACAIGVVVAEQGSIVYKEYCLIRPPRREFIFSYLHGITWEDVKDKPGFGEVWKKIKKQLDGIKVVAAHNASFDRGVLHACCGISGITPPNVDFLCTMKLSRRIWGIRPTRLSNVCKHFNIPLHHHDAASDALACAKIVLEASASGIPINAFLKKAACWNNTCL